MLRAGVKARKLLSYFLTFLRMNTRALLLLPGLSVCMAALLPGCAYIKHVPPGQSLSAAMAKKAELVALPAPPPQPPQPVAAISPEALSVPPSPNMPDPETEAVADAFTLGNLCLQQGRYADAIAAYQDAVKRDPSFADAWNKLAIAYQNSGQDAKAMAAFKMYKSVAEH